MKASLVWRISWCADGWAQNSHRTTGSRCESERRPGISAERRKALTDRAVLHGDLEALQELSLYRPDRITASKEQRAAAIAAGSEG